MMPTRLEAANAYDGTRVTLQSGPLALEFAAFAASRLNEHRSTSGTRRTYPMTELIAALDVADDLVARFGLVGRRSTHDRHSSVRSGIGLRRPVVVGSVK